MSVFLAVGHEFRAFNREVIARHFGALIDKIVLMGFVHLQGFGHIENILVFGSGFGDKARSDFVFVVSQVFEHPFPYGAVVEPDACGIVLLAVLEGEVIVHQRIIETVAAHAVRESVEIRNPDFVFDIGDAEHTPFGKSAADIGRTVHLYRLEPCSGVFVSDLCSVYVQDKIDPGMDFDGLVNGLLEDISIHIFTELDVLRIAGVQKIKIQPGTVAERGLFHLKLF